METIYHLLHYYNLKALQENPVKKKYFISQFREKSMTKSEAESLKSFDHYCTCGGYAWQINGRSESDPHMPWCPQKKQYDEWYRAKKSPCKTNN